MRARKHNNTRDGTCAYIDTMPYPTAHAYTRAHTRTQEHTHTRAPKHTRKHNHMETSQHVHARTSHAIPDRKLQMGKFLEKFSRFPFVCVCLIIHAIPELLHAIPDPKAPDSIRTSTYPTTLRSEHSDVIYRTLHTKKRNFCDNV